MTPPARLLVADDNAVNRRILGGALVKAGYQVIEASDGQEAVSRARANRPDLVLLDVAMPHRDGFEVCTILRSEPDTARTPIIFVTAKFEPDDIARAFALGASDYVTKPFHMTEVKARISAHLRLVEAQEELARTQSRLLRAHKLEAIGQLAAGVAHEINTPTQYVSDNAHFLRDAFDDLVRVLGQVRQVLSSAGSPGAQFLAPLAATAREVDLDYLLEEVPRSLSQSIDGLGRIAEIVRAMKEFSHPGQRERLPTDIHRGIASTLIVARNEWKYVADVVTEFDPALPAVPCAAGDLNQVVLNLVVNAAHAVAEKLRGAPGSKGRITISTRRAGEWVEIRVSDTGCGVPEAIRERIFEPYFTTKGVGQGTGQGLALAHAVVVEGHGGTIGFESEEGVGSTFLVRLPLEIRPEAAA